MCADTCVHIHARTHTIAKIKHKESHEEEVTLLWQELVVGLSPGDTHVAKYQNLWPTLSQSSSVPRWPRPTDIV